ncbi:MAG: WG repeat-containing protein [Oscillospiraceae bacterium]|nr:WG repeat-containing protein [Oscillospiraceae bacterium]
MNNKWKIINKNGNEVIPLYDSMLQISEGMVAVMTGDDLESRKWGFIAIEE